MIRGPDEDLPPRDRRRGETGLAQDVVAHELIRRRGLDDERLAVVVHEVHVPARRDERSAVPAAEALLPLQFARLRVETAGNPVVGDDEKISPVRYWRRDVADAAVCAPLD